MRKNRIRSTSSSISSQNSKFRKKFVPPRKLSAPLKPISNATSSNETKKTFKAPVQKFKPPTKSSFKPPTKTFKAPVQTFKPPKRSTGFAAPAFVSKPVDVSEKQTAKRYLYEVMFCKRSKKKRKTYDDGLLIISSKKKAYFCVPLTSACSEQTRARRAWCVQGGVRNAARHSRVRWR